MASVTRDRARSSWVADFRAPFAPGSKRRRVRVPVSRLRGAPDEKAVAVAFADECERLCRLLEEEPGGALIREALELGAINQSMAEDLAEGLPPREWAPGPPLLADLARAHESAQREERGNLPDHQRHARELREFVEFSGAKAIDQLRLDDVRRWRDHLERRGYKYDGIRHRLLPIRWASRMGVEHGFPDILAGFILARRGYPRAPEVWSLDELRLAAKRLADEDNARALAALGLGGFCGLRSSEVYRLRVGDLDAGRAALRVGAEIAKNRWSRRTLAIPPTVLEWCVSSAGGRPADHFIVPPLTGRGRAKAAGFDRAAFSRWIGPVLARATGRKLTPKTLRASFLTWAARSGMPARWFEAYAGHSPSYAANVTARHYLAEVGLNELRPAAEAIEAAISGADSLLFSGS